MEPPASGERDAGVTPHSPATLTNCGGPLDVSSGPTAEFLESFSAKDPINSRSFLFSITEPVEGKALLGKVCNSHGFWRSGNEVHFGGGMGRKREILQQNTTLIFKAHGI